MMKTFRRLTFIFALIIVGICIGLLITSYTPFNPTNRRYSSRPVDTTGNSNDIGLSGEKVLSDDLGIPRNDEQTPRLVVCNTRYENSSPPEKNTKCIYYSNEITNYRIPDFVSDDIIAESKNRRVWYKRDLDQIRAFTLASKELHRPLWVYVRHNTEVPEEYHEIVNTTGGRIVYYFATDGYVAPIDFNLLLMITGALGTMVVVLLWKIFAGFFAFIRRNTPKPKSSVVVPEHKTSRNAKNAVDSSEDFMRNAGDSARNTLDE
jgi:hypothetical protein